jgi:hypothetical protein
MPTGGKSSGKYELRDSNNFLPKRFESATMKRQSMTKPIIREPEQIRQDAARKLRPVEVSDNF